MAEIHIPGSEPLQEELRKHEQMFAAMQDSRDGLPAVELVEQPPSPDEVVT